MPHSPDQPQASTIDLRIKHHFSNHLYAKQMHLPKGCFALSHKHSYSHLSILAGGRAQVEADGVVQIHEPGSCIEIAAGVEHKITALDDLTWFCIHATDETDVSNIDQVLIGGK